MAAKLPKPKKVNFRLIPPKDGPAHDHIPEGITHDRKGTAIALPFWNAARNYETG